MPKLVRLYVDSVLVGFALAIAFLVVLVVLDVARLGHLVLASPDGMVASVMIVTFFGTLFASVQFAYVIMREGMAEQAAPPRSRHDTDR